VCCGAWGNVSLSKPIIMKKFSSIAVLTAFFVCGIALGAHARDVEKIARQGLVSVEISNETVPWHDFNILPVSSVPDFKAEKAEPAKEKCTVTIKRKCPDGSTATATASGDSYEEAGAKAGRMVDAGC